MRRRLSPWLFQENAGVDLGLLEWKPEAPVEDVAVNGFIRSVRSMKTHRFISLGDGSTVAPYRPSSPADHAEGVSAPRPAVLICLPRLLTEALRGDVGSLSELRFALRVLGFRRRAAIRVMNYT